ncbi:UNVERIFIED_CONTAM: hypothetical protein GTU68_030817 [Idotea baltica]|nr:hypothetical protein [Idotea baltica]
MVGGRSSAHAGPTVNRTGQSYRGQPVPAVASRHRIGR